MRKVPIRARPGAALFSPNVSIVTFREISKVRYKNHFFHFSQNVTIEATPEVGRTLGAARHPPEKMNGFRMRYEIEEFFESLFCDFKNVPISDTCPKESICVTLFGAPEGDFCPPYRVTGTLYSGPPAPPPVPATSI